MGLHARNFALGESKKEKLLFALEQLSLLVDLKIMRQTKPIGGLTVGGRPKASGSKIISSKPSAAPAPQPAERAPVESTKDQKGSLQNRAISVKQEHVDRIRATTEKAPPLRQAPRGGEITSAPAITKSTNLLANNNQFTNLPRELPFPPTISREIAKILDGSKMEAPFTTEMFKEFPPRGFYACIRCQQPIAAATSKVACDFGYAGFCHFNAQGSDIVVGATSDGIPFLEVRCGKCKGLLGELIQKQISEENIEVLKVNSCCLHFVDRDVSSFVMGNYLERTSAKQSDSEENDDLEIALGEVDFDDLDVIGTLTGAATAQQKKRDLHDSWRRCPSVELQPTVEVRPAVTVTSEQRHKGNSEALNEYSSSSEDEESISSESDS